MTAVNDTLLELQRSINTLTGSVGTLSGQINTFMAQMATHDERTTDLEVRTRKVENRQHWYSGAGAVIGIIIGKYAPGMFGHT
jgi:hypothetical protein